MTFEWDETKNAANLKKHGISFEEAVLVFDEPVFSRIDRRFEYGEERIVSIGLIGAIVMVVVVHTARNGKTRIISARTASRDERRNYDKHQKKTT